MRIAIGFVLLGLTVTAADRPPNIVVILADQMQANRLHTYGNPRPTSPNIDALAAAGVKFNRFYSVAPWTAPSQGTIATSLYPSRHGETLFMQRTSPPAFTPDTVTLAQAFKNSGYHTGAFVNNAVAGPYLLGKGFDDFDVQVGVSLTPASKAENTNPRIYNWLDKVQSNPFFLYIDYWEPHSPYMPPPTHDLFKSEAYPDQTTVGFDPNPAELNLVRWANLNDRQAIARIIQLYDGFIHYVDFYMGQLVDEFKRRGLYNNTIFLISSDHGELLYSHPEDYLTMDHRSLYDAALHVPAIFFGKNIPSGKTVNVLASNIDLAPTLLELAGAAPMPVAQVQGLSLAPLIHGDATAAIHEYIFSEQDLTEQLRCVRDKRYKLILNITTGRQQLFDSVKDPAESVDVSAIYPKVVARLSAVLDQWRRANENPVAMLNRWKTMLPNPSPVDLIDNVTSGANLQLTGDRWSLAVRDDDYNGNAYWTEPAGPEEAVRTAQWRTNNLMFGSYRISIYYGSLNVDGAATNMPVLIKTRTHDYATELNLTRNTGQWQVLGTFTDPLAVVISNQANGRVIADAVKFEFLNH
jgi:arylsulfatase